VTGVFFLLRPSADALALKLPTSIDDKIGSLAFRQTMLQMREVKTPTLVEPLAKMVDALKTASPASRFPYRSYVVDRSDINAMAAPGGHVIVFSGLLANADTPEEVLGVLAHELGHVEKRHTLRQISRSVGTFAIIQLLLGDLTGIAAALIEGGGNLLTLKFSREFEEEADDYGWDLLGKAGIDQSGMISFFEKMHRRETEMRKQIDQATGISGAANALDWIGTHPNTNERIQRLKAKPRADHAQNKVVLTPAEFAVMRTAAVKPQ
jgi:predicted Zn-dependent protease